MIIADFSIRYAEMITRVSPDLRGSPVIGVTVFAAPERGVLRAVKWWSIQFVSTGRAFLFEDSQSSFRTGVLMCVPVARQIGRQHGRLRS